jgi:hypothetical protein
LSIVSLSGICFPPVNSWRALAAKNIFAGTVGMISPRLIVTEHGASLPIVFCEVPQFLKGK